MNPFEILTKPLNLDPKLFTPAKLPPLPAIKSPLSFLTTPLSAIVKEKTKPVNVAPKAPFKSPFQMLNTPLPENVTRLFKGPIQSERKVRDQDFKDVINMVPKIARLVAQPVADVTLSVRQALTGKEAKFKIPLPFQGQGAYPVDSPAPGWFKQRLEKETRQSLHPQVVYGAWQDYVEQHNRAQKYAYEPETLQKTYKTSIEKGDSPTKATLKTALKAGLDLSVALPLLRSAGRAITLATAPERLISTQIVNIERQALRDYFSGAKPNINIPLNVREAIGDIMKTGTREEKLQLLRGIDLLEAKPSILGRTFGLSQEEANALLRDLYSGPVREAPAGALPGYARDEATPAFGLSTEKKKPVGFEDKKLRTIQAEEFPEFEGFKDITTNVLDRLKGKGGVSKQYIQDLTNMPELKQAERDIIRNVLNDYPEGDIPVIDFANKVKSELLPLKSKQGRESFNQRYESITLPDELRGPIANYQERIYESPIKTSAGGVHFGDEGTDSYFAHTRIEDLPTETNIDALVEAKQAGIPREQLIRGQTRRVIEIQSDLFQKGRLERENVTDEAYQRMVRDIGEARAKNYEPFAKREARAAELSKLEPYRNTWHERVIREEVKQAAVDGKTKLQFPTGETAMKIEGLGETNRFLHRLPDGRLGPVVAGTDTLKVGDRISNGGNANDFIVTEVLGEGKFKAILERTWENNLNYSVKNAGVNRYESVRAKKLLDGDEIPTKADYDLWSDNVEIFDISGKVDTSNPIYRFYEKEVGRYLSNKYGAKRVKDAQGVEWYEVKVDPKMTGEPITAYGAIAGIEEDEEGNLKFNPAKAALGMVAGGFLRKNKQGFFVGRGKGRIKDLKISPREIEEANAELNRLFQEQSLAKRISVLSTRIGELNAEKNFIKQSLERHPARELAKHVAKSGEFKGGLPEALGKGKTKFGREGDELAEIVGFEDSEKARTGYEEYKKIQDTLRSINKQIALIKKELDIHKAFETVAKSDPSLKREYQAVLRQIRQTERQIERNLLSPESRKNIASIRAKDGGLPEANFPYDKSIAVSVSDVKPPVGRGKVTPPELHFLNWKDGRALSLSRETMERNIEAVARADAPAVKKFLVEPIRKNETRRTAFVNTLRRELRENIVEKLGIKARSKESRMVQQYGERQFDPDPAKNLEQLQGLRPNDWHRIKEASEILRGKYDELLDMVNAERETFGYKPIPKHQDYFRHFQAIDSAIRQFGLLLREQDLPTEIAGLTGIFNPGKPFSTAELRRRGEFGATEDAVRGMDNYLDSISRQIFHIDSVTRGRALEKYIRESAKAGAKSDLESEQVKLPNFVSNLHDYTNIVSGKKSALDRALEGTFGRRIYTVSNLFRRRLGANMIVGNLSSAMTNFIPFTQSLTTTNKMDALHGLGEALMSPWKMKYPVIDGVQSDFLLRRFPERAIDFRKIDKAAQIASWLFEAVDKFTAKSIVSGKYFENLSKGASKEEAMLKANAYAGKTLADRSLGQIPNIFSSQSLGFISQFQTEVNNAFSFMTRDIPTLSEKKKGSLISMLLQFFVYSYLFNEGYERVIGRRPTIDPIYAALTLMGLNEENEDVAFKRRLANAVEDVGGNLPFVGGITGGRFPISGSLPNVLDLLKDETTASKELKKLLYFLPPFGGAQIKKTFEGLKTVKEGKEKTPSGKSTRYRVKETPLNYLRAGLFGKSSLPEAQTYYKSLDKKYAPAKNTRGLKSRLKDSGIKLIPKAGIEGINLKQVSPLSGIKLVPKKKIQLTP